MLPRPVAQNRLFPLPLFVLGVQKRLSEENRGADHGTVACPCQGCNAGGAVHRLEKRWSALPLACLAAMGFTSQQLPLLKSDLLSLILHQATRTRGSYTFSLFLFSSPVIFHSSHLSMSEKLTLS